MTMLLLMIEIYYIYIFKCTNQLLINFDRYYKTKSKSKLTLKYNILENSSYNKILLQSV